MHRGVGMAALSSLITWRVESKLLMPVMMCPSAAKQTAVPVVVQSLVIVSALSAPGMYLAAVHRPESTEKVYALMM